MSDTSLSSLDSGDEIHVPRHAVFRDRANPMEMFDNLDFKSRFRFSKNTVTEMLNIFGHEFQRVTRRNKAITPENQLLVTLRFLATGSFQQIVGDTFHVHKSTVSRVIRSVTHCIARLKPEFINMPATREEQQQEVVRFYNMHGFPGVIGAIDCTHVKIESPGGENAETFRNRKGFFSINVQAVCDSALKIRNIVVRWPGSVHDSTIFNDSPLKVDLEIGVYGNFYLLGDNGYPCRSYLLTPFLNPANASEAAYNRAHVSTRNPIERLFGVIKRRFACLSVGMRIKLDRVLTTIVACCVLHNIGIMHNDDFLEEDIPEAAIVIPVVQEDLDTSVPSEHPNVTVISHLENM